MANFQISSFSIFSLHFNAELDLDRYKFIVQVVIGEQRGEGVK